MDGTEPAGARSESRTGREPPTVGGTLAFLDDPLAVLQRCRDAVDADVVAVDVAGDRSYVLTHPDAVERVLVTDAPSFGKGEVARNSLGIGLPNSLVVTEGQQWRRDRQLLQGLFQRERLADYADEMAAVATETLAGWEPGEPVEVTEEMQRLSLRVLTRTLLSVDLGDRLETVERATAGLRGRFDSERLSTYLPVWVPTPSNVRAGLALADLYDLVGGIVSERRAALRSGGHGGAESEPVPDDLLTQLLTATYPDGSRPDAHTIRDQLLTFLVAGHETTALTLTYACYLLATNPEKQARLREGLRGVTGGGDDEIPARPALDALDSADFLDAVVSEALRLYPPAFVVFREPEADVRIRGYEVPAGSVLAMPQWAIHRDPRWWRYPESFRPERFLAGEDGDEDGQTISDDDRPEYAFFPFGGGPRHCIGMRFARQEAKLALAAVLSNYRLEPGTEPPLSVRMQLTLQPDEPVTVVPLTR